MHHERTIDAARGSWRGILMELGVDKNLLTGRHAPCPSCGGTDRFRFDNQEGSGSWICNQCGAGYGIDLAMRVTGGDFKSVASRIDAIVGNVKPDGPSKPKVTPERAAEYLRLVWKRSRPAQAGGLVDAYLRTRMLDDPVYPPSLRETDSVSDGEGSERPAMLAVVSGPDGQPVTLHRTFLREGGSGKAQMERVRKMLPAKCGELPDGVAVRLSDFQGGALGIAEGIETALAASALYEMPVWAALNAGLLERWSPPEGCEEVTIFGDNDSNFRGQAAAYRVANRLKSRKDAPEVSVMFPPVVGQDFADLWMAYKARNP